MTAIDNIKPAMLEIASNAKHIAELKDHGGDVLEQIITALIGLRVRKHGRIYEIAGARIGIDGNIDASGYTVSRHGKVGTRQFALYEIALDDIINEGAGNDRPNATRGAEA